LITEDARIIGNRSLGERYGLLSLRLKEMGRSFGPGQFVQMEIPGRPDLIMRRPMSPLRIVEEDGEFRMDVLYLVVGEGTRHLTGLREGGTINLLGPLGRSFAPPADHGPAFLVAGGTGLGPIYMLAQELCESHDVTFFYGARNAAELFCRDDIQAFRGRTVFCTDDGSFGRKGVVTEVLKRQLSRIRPTLYACGPKGMLAAVQELSRDQDLAAQVSLEERMGCGVGACLSCAVESTGGGYMMVCKDGPVFQAGDVVLTNG